MQYRIELSPTRKGVARVHFPGRILALEARRHAGAAWLVGVGDAEAPEAGSVTVRAGHAGDAVWRVAQATVRAVAELIGEPIEGAVTVEFEDSLGDLA